MSPREAASVFSASSSDLLRHQFWRKLRLFMPGKVWAALYSFRERASSSRYLRQLEKELPNTSGVDPYQDELTTAWKKFGAVGKAEAGYGPIYSALVSRLKKVYVANILEIGVFAGGSHRAWSSIFPKAEIYGFDIDPATKVMEPKIRTVVGDQLDYANLIAIRSGFPPSFQLIVDDGWHQPEAGINSLRAFLPMLDESGYYVVEDIDIRRYRRIWERVGRAISSSFSTSLIEVETPGSLAAVGGPYGLFIAKRI